MDKIIFKSERGHLCPSPFERSKNGKRLVINSSFGKMKHFAHLLASLEGASG
jgi:hypothetical protein